MKFETRIIALIAVLALTIVATADPPCHVRQVIAPQKVLHSQAIHAATIYHDTHLAIVEVPVPAFVFQTLTAYQPAQQAISHGTGEGVGTDDMLSAMFSAPDPVMEIRQKCASCHSSEAGTAKGGLTLFDQSGAFRPVSRNKSLTSGLIAARARSTESDAMPPGVLTNPAKRLSNDAIRFLEFGR